MANSFQIRTTLASLFAIVATVIAFSAPVRVGVLSSYGNSYEDPRSATYNPANVRPKMQQNVDRTLALLTQAGQQGCDIVCTPEDIAGIAKYVWYGYDYLPGEWDPITVAMIDTIPNAITNQISNVAKTYSMNIIAGLYTKESNGKYYNSAIFFDRTGKIAGKYNKVHLPHIEEWWLTPGDSFTVFNTDFGAVGTFICYDISFPEAAQTYALKGANLLFHCTSALEFWGTSNLVNAIPLRMRAYDNKAYVACSNYGAGVGFIDPYGQVMSEATSYNTVHVRDIDVAAEPRDTSGWKNIWGTELIRAIQYHKRKPSAYSLIGAATSPVRTRYNNVNIITGADTAELAVIVGQQSGFNRPYFTSSRTIEVRPGETVDYRVTYGNPTGATVSLTYFRVPSWLTGAGTSLIGTAPLSERTDTVRIAMQAGSFKDTLPIRIFVRGTPMVGFQELGTPRLSKYLAVQPSALSNGGINFTVIAEKPGDISLSIYDIEGRKIWGYDRKDAEQGIHSVYWDGIPFTKRSVSAKASRVPAGQYIVLAKQNTENVIKMLTMMK